MACGVRQTKHAQAKIAQGRESSANDATASDARPARWCSDTARIHIHQRQQRCRSAIGEVAGLPCPRPCPSTPILSPRTLVIFLMLPTATMRCLSTRSDRLREGCCTLHHTRANINHTHRRRSSRRNRQTTETDSTRRAATAAIPETVHLHCRRRTPPRVVHRRSPPARAPKSAARMAVVAVRSARRRCRCLHCCLTVQRAARGWKPRASLPRK